MIAAPRAGAFLRHKCRGLTEEPVDKVTVAHHQNRYMRRVNHLLRLLGRERGGVIRLAAGFLQRWPCPQNYIRMSGSCVPDSAAHLCPLVVVSEFASARGGIRACELESQAARLPVSARWHFTANRACVS